MGDGDLNQAPQHQNSRLSYGGSAGGKKAVVEFTANVERKLEDIELFPTEVEAPRAFDGLLDELLVTVIPNLERFPEMGRPFMARQPRSIETTNIVRLRGALGAIGQRDGTIRHTGKNDKQ